MYTWDSSESAKKCVCSCPKRKSHEYFISFENQLCIVRLFFPHLQTLLKYTYIFNFIVLLQTLHCWLSCTSDCNRAGEILCLRLWDNCNCANITGSTRGAGRSRNRSTANRWLLLFSQWILSKIMQTAQKGQIYQFTMVLIYSLLRW